MSSASRVQAPRGRARPGAGPAALLSLLLLGAFGRAAQAQDARPDLVALVPADQPLLIDLDLQRLRQLGPEEAVGRLQRALGPRLQSLGLRLERLRRVVLSGSVDRHQSEERRPTILLIEQEGEPPDLAQLREALGDRGPERTIHYRGTTYRRGRRISLAVLPRGPAVLVNGPATLMQRVIDLYRGRSRASLAAGAAESLLGRLGGGAAPVRLWLRLPPAMQREVQQAGVPAAPRELAGVALVGEGGGLDLRAVGLLPDPQAAQAVAGWLRQRLQALEGETQVQLLGLSPLVRAVEVATGGGEATLRLPLSRSAYAGLLERLIGLSGLLPLPLGGGKAQRSPSAL